MREKEREREIVNVRRERKNKKKERWRGGRREIKVAETYKIACTKIKNEVKRD